ncbi:hypothetical protein OTU49_007632, partial [Cherax quadricarinatus]
FSRNMDHYVQITSSSFPPLPLPSPPVLVPPLPSLFFIPLLPRGRSDLSLHISFPQRFESEMSSFFPSPSIHPDLQSSQYYRLLYTVIFSFRPGIFCDFQHCFDIFIYFMQIKNNTKG